MTSNSDISISKELELARSHYHNGNLQEARQIVEGLLRADPANVDALLLAAELYRPDNPQLAFKVYARAAQLAPQRPEVPAGMALLYLDQGNMAQCDQCLDATIDLDPEYLRSRHYSGMAKVVRAVLSQGESARDAMVDFYDSIAAAYQRAVKRYRDSPLVAFNLARILFVLGEPELAGETYGLCLELDPQMTEAYAGMVEVSFALERYEEAAEWAGMLEGRSWHMTGDANDPEWMTARAVAGDLSLGHTYRVQAKAHLWMGQFEDMTQAIRRAVELEPWNSAEWYSDLLDEQVKLGKALLENNQLSDAISVLEVGRDLANRMKYHALFLWLAEAYLAQALVYQEAKDQNQARAWSDRANEIVQKPPVPVPVEARAAWVDLRERLSAIETPSGLFGLFRR